MRQPISIDGRCAKGTVAARLWGLDRVGGPVLFGRRVTARLPAKGGVGDVFPYSPYQVRARACGV
jgi:hypothetical protein